MLPAQDTQDDQIETDPLASLNHLSLRVNHEDVVYLGQGIKLVVRKTRANRVDLYVSAPGVPVQLVRKGVVKVGKQYPVDHIEDGVVLDE